MRALLAVVALLGACASEPRTLPGLAHDTGTAVEDAPAVSAETATGSTLPPPRAGAIRVASLNVRRLFDAVCDSGNCDGSAFEAVATPAGLDARLAQLAERLLYLNADVIMVAEVETAALLDALAAKMPGFVTHVLGEIGFTASVDVGVLSRFPTLEVRKHRDLPLTRPDGSPTSFTREFLEVHLDRGGKRVVAFAAHFRSKNADDPGRRYAEAVAAGDIVRAAAAETPDALVVLGGDLNDVPGSPPIAALDERLARPSLGLPADAIATYWFEGRGQAIDHLYLPTAARYLAGTFAVARDPGRRTFAGSDHAAVYADLE